MVGAAMGCFFGVEVPDALISGVSVGGSTMSLALWIPWRARGDDFNRSGIVLFTVSFACFARSERRFACGRTITVGCARPIVVSYSASTSIWDRRRCSAGHVREDWWARQGPRRKSS